jgi:hypothetical protein
MKKKKSEAKNLVTLSLEGIVVGKSQHYFYCFPNAFSIWMIVSLLLSCIWGRLFSTPSKEQTCIYAEPEFVNL